MAQLVLAEAEAEEEHDLEAAAVEHGRSISAAVVRTFHLRSFAQPLDEVAPSAEVRQALQLVREAQLEVSRYTDTDHNPHRPQVCLDLAGRVGVDDPWKAGFLAPHQAAAEEVQLLVPVSEEEQLEESAHQQTCCCLSSLNRDDVEL